MELHPLVREILFCFIPTHKTLFRYDINLGAFRTACSAAVVMPTAQRRVICHDIQGYNVRYEIGFNVVVIPVSALRFLPVVNMTVDDYTVVEADGRLLFEKTLQGRPQKAPDVFDGAFATLLSGKQPGNPEGKPAVRGKANLNGNFVLHDLLDVLPCMGRTQQ